MDNENTIKSINNIVVELEKLNSKSIYNIYEPQFQFLFTIIAVFLGALIGYCFTIIQIKKESRKNCYLDYLKILTNYLASINKIIMNIVQINTMLGWMICREKYIPFRINNFENYHNIINKIKELRYYLNTEFEKYWEKNSVYEIYYTTLENKINELINFDLFTNLTYEMQKESANYYFKLSDKIRDKHNYIINEIYKYSHNDMIDFNIENFKNKILNHIYEIEKLINKI